RWGRWQDGIGVGPAEREILGRLDATLRARLAAFGTGPQRYGLVHADTRLANLLVDGDAVSVIDFDDSGFSWFLYDVGTSVSFFEHEPHVPALVDAWLSGYRRVLVRAAPGAGGQRAVILSPPLPLLPPLAPPPPPRPSPPPPPA